MDSCEWLFSDCFDTLLIRKCSADSVKRKWAKTVSCDLDFAVSNSDIYEIRRSVERCLQKRCENGEFRGEELFWHIVNRIAISYHMDLTEKQVNQLVNKMVTAEYQAEISSLYANDSLLKQFVKSGKRIVVVSDYHMSSEFLTKIFYHFGIENLFTRVFTSSDARCNKHTGELYEYVLEKMGIDGKQVQMYGDSKTSDVFNAEARGIQGVLVKKTCLMHRDTISDVIADLKSVLIQERYSVDSLGNYGAALYLMIDRLYRQCTRQGIEHIYFLSREGELLKRLFDYYTEGKGERFSTHYLYVSRRATVLSSLKSLSEEDFSIAGGIFENKSMEYFMQTVGFTEKECEEIRRRYQLDFCAPIQNFSKSQELDLLKSDSKFNEIYNQKVIILHERFENYLNQEGFYLSNKVALVDVGWNGTIQNCIAKFKKETQTIYGYYCGLVSSGTPSISSQKFGLLFSDVYGRSRDYDIWSFDHTAFERILTASHAATIGYEVVDGEVMPCFKKYESESNSYSLMEPIQKLIIQVFKKIDNIMCDSPYSTEEVYMFFLETHIRTVLELGQKKAKFLQKLYKNQVENFYSGSTTEETLKKLFSIKQVLKKALRRIGLLKNTEIMIKICAQNNLYFLIPPFTALKKTRWLRRMLND